LTFASGSALSEQAIGHICAEYTAETTCNGCYSTAPGSGSMDLHTNMELLSYCSHQDNDR
jgi:hypothetical protein